MTARPTDASRSAARTFWAVALGALALDQGVKVSQRALMDLGDTIPIIDGWLHLTYTLNTGAAFSMLSGSGRVLAITAPIALAALYVFWRTLKPSSWVPAVGSGLIAAGALGNGIDRLFFGSVTDLIDVRIINFAVFNVADAAITVGGILLAVWMLFLGGIDALESALEHHDVTPEEDGR